MNNAKNIRVNIGCGRSPTKGWLNFDNSPSIKLARSPLKFKLSRLLGLLYESQIENVNWNRKNKIHFADATKMLPLADSSVETLYSSHMFEHLSREGAEFFLKDSLRVLETDGILRISVPDLKIAAQNYYIEEDANNFMNTLLVEAPKIDTLKEKLSLLFNGYRHHQWMYDGKSLSDLFRKVGFKNVVICSAGETTIQNPEGLNLFERDEQSVFVEGSK